MKKNRKKRSDFASLIEWSDLLPVPWKNGGGTSREIAIHPSDASLAKMDFIWRLSSANVDREGPFSVFPDYQRWLTLVRGEELELNFSDGRKILRPGTVLHFPGEAAVSATIPKGAVSDLGLIYDPDRALAKLSLLELKGRPRSFALSSPTVLLFAIEGEFLATLYPGEGEFLMSEGDTLLIEHCPEERLLCVDAGEERALMAAVEIALVEIKSNA